MPPSTLMRRRAALPRPAERSTLAAGGLNYQVRNGCWVFPRRYDRRKGCFPLKSEGLKTGKRTRNKSFVKKTFRPLVQVSSNPYGSSTSCLSNTYSRCGLTALKARNPNLGDGFPLRCFQRLSDPQAANQQCFWQNNWRTVAASTPVLSYWGQASSRFPRAQRIETKLSHDVLNPARVPL